MVYEVTLRGLDDEAFYYDTIEEAIEGAGRLARAALSHYEVDGVQRDVEIHAYPVEGGSN